jgi:AraC-like DNA-binding protein
LEENYDKDISLEQLAKTFGYSVEHLSRMFVKYAKVNFKSYLQNIRLEYARKELLKEEKKIGEIAVNVGFADSRAMAKAFKKQYGILPKEYRSLHLMKK